MSCIRAVQSAAGKPHPAWDRHTATPSSNSCPFTPHQTCARLHVRRRAHHAHTIVSLQSNVALEVPGDSRTAPVHTYQGPEPN